MKIRLKGEKTLADIRQEIYEQLYAVEEDYGVRFSFGATLYINPTNGFGDKVVPRDEKGEEVKSVKSPGPYRSAADEYNI